MNNGGTYMHDRLYIKILDMSGQYDDMLRFRVETAFISSKDHFIWVETLLLVSIWIKQYQIISAGQLQNIKDGGTCMNDSS